MKAITILGLGFWVAAPTAWASEEPPSFEGENLFESKIRPLFIEHCYECHSAGAEEIKGGLRLDTRDDLRRGGDGGPVVDPGHPEHSRLITAVRRVDEKLQMPPQADLAPHEIQALVEWVRLGAPDPRADTSTPSGQGLQSQRGSWWSLRPVREPPLPRVKRPEWPLSPIDFFIQAALESRSLDPVPVADRPTLIRRLTFDLIGLPPSPEEIRDFARDPDPLPKAWEKVVDRLLASPHYGERWGRHWMDLVRYADTAGDNSDYPVPQLYLYRNYVIDSFNRDTPFNRFIQEQLAGDLLPASDLETRNRQIIATGYLALSRRFGSIIDGYPRHLTIEDTIDNLGRVFLGLTINCARCHDHKFDDISMEDYYGLYGIFDSTRYPFPGIELDKVPRDFVPLIETSEVEKILAPYRSRLAALDEEIETLKAANSQTTREEDGEQSESRRKRLQSAIKQREALGKRPPSVPSAYAMAEGSAADAAIHMRGDPQKPGAIVPRKFLDLLGGQVLTEEESRGSGRRSLADWITDPSNPLTARVIVNRVWQHHFGSALVKTTSDFGQRGQPPSHPELLDWLAWNFVRNGWSFKALHRVILCSKTYQLSSQEHPANLISDPDNDWHWRFNRRRLDAEQLRDSMMLVAGTLRLGMACEPHPIPPSSEWQYTQHHPFKDEYPCQRRSVYMLQKRLTAQDYYQTFDGPDSNASTSDRDSSVTTVQALFFLNSGFVEEQSLALARRLEREHRHDHERVDWLFNATLGRGPTDAEARQALRHVRQAHRALTMEGIPQGQTALTWAWASLGNVMFRLNEFLYID